MSEMQQPFNNNIQKAVDAKKDFILKERSPDSIGSFEE